MLLVEDEPVLASIVKESLEKRGFSIHIARNGVEGWSIFKTMQPDVCIIDIMLPRKDGFSLVADIRTVNDRIPLIFLTARTQTEDVLKGLELGADDFMKKPFSMEELVLRLKSLVRRNTGNSPSFLPYSAELIIGNFCFNYQRLELSYGEQKAKLSQREGDLLQLLIKHKNDLLERNVALLKLWGDNSSFSARSMDVYITRLRKFIKSDPSLEIINYRGQGYSLVEHGKAEY